MAGELEQLGLNSTYRLGVPDRRVYDPSAAEQILLKEQIGGPNSDTMLGFYLGAQADTQANARRYEQQFAGANNLQYQLGTQRLGVEREKIGADVDKAILANPNAAYMLGGTRQRIAPDAMDVGRALTELLPEQAAAETRETNAKAVLANTQGGALPPPDMQYSLLGANTQRLGVGAPLALRVQQEESRGRIASSGGGGDGAAFKPSDVNALNKELGDIENERLRSVADAEQYALGKSSVTYDAQSGVLKPAEITPEKARDYVQRMTDMANRAAKQRELSVRESYGRSGFASRLPTTRPDYSTAPSAPAPSDDRTAPPPVTNNAGVQRGPPSQQTPAASGARPAVQYKETVDDIRTRVAGVQATDPGRSARLIDAARQRHGAGYRIVTRNGIPVAEIGDARGVKEEIPLR